ncbi:MAG: LPS-assembly protein LptD [Rhodocyclaceae bacterium]
MLSTESAIPLAPGATRVRAERLDGRNQFELTAEGKVILRRDSMFLLSDRLRLDQISNEVTAEGSVSLLRGRDRIDGPRAQLNLDTSVGEVTKPHYVFQRDSAPFQKRSTTLTATGEAETLLLEGKNQYRLQNATYTTCQAPDPDWYLKVRDLSLDYDRERGEAYDAVLRFKNVPVMWMPWADFPLNDSRQSGLLPPTIGSTSSTGFDITQPYYVNLAPNYDATLAPRWMGRRGLQLGTEFRYLTKSGTGRLSGEWLPKDQLTQEERGLISARNFQDFGKGLNGSLDYNQVTDANYFADLSSRITSTSQATLNQQAILNYGGLPWLSSSLNVQRFQTLVGEAPYDRLPQLRADLNVPDQLGMAVRMPFEYTKFEHAAKDAGERTTIHPQLAVPLQNSYAFFVPKAGIHLSHYDLTRRTTTGYNTLYRSVPGFSLDSGLNFERSLKLGQSDFIQTLEPRVFYVRTAYRDQSQFPVFDTARADFNFSQLFSENIYTGSDRIADANQMTSAVTSRFISEQTGEEALRLAVGQRFYFSGQEVTLPGETRRDGRIADWLGLMSGRLTRSIWVDSFYQYDPREHRSERGVLTTRYQPQAGKSAAVSYRYQRGVLRDIDFSGQWPVTGGWYAVGRYNYNLKDSKLTEAIAGFEYKAGCWVLRTVYQTLLNTKQVRNNAIYLQLELNGLASVGSSPVQLLRRSVGGYTDITSTGDPVFGTSAE